MHLRYTALLGIFVFSSIWSETIRVRIEKGADLLQLNGKIDRVQNLETGLSGSTQIQCDGRSWKIWQNRDLVLQVEGHHLLLNGRSLKTLHGAVPERLSLSCRRGVIQVVGEVPLEEYIAGVVGSEMPKHWPVEALKAQAVAARSYVLAVKASRSGGSFDVESTVQDQVYRHSNSLDRRVQRAVADTHGEVLELGQAVHKAFYHSNCGGQTTNPQNVWGYGQPAGRVQSCPSRGTHNWSLRMSKGQIEEALDFANLEGITVHQRDGQRARWVELVAADKSKRLSGHEFRKALGFSRFKSTAFQVYRSGNEWHFHGEGFGHGVGLCQWGARTLAKRGRSYRDILSFYYPEARIGNSTLPPNGASLNQYASRE